MTLDSSFWELYLHKAFKELGFAVDYGKVSPDFCIAAPEPLIVEATVSLHAVGGVPMTETDPLEKPDDFNEFDRQAIIRLANSIDSKVRKYRGSYAALPHVAGKPFVIAVAAFDRPHFYLQAQRAVEALLYRSYVDEEQHLRDHPKLDVPLKVQDLPFVKKDSGAKIDLGLFCDDSLPEVSAIIQSTSATWSKVRAMCDDPDVMIEAIYEDRVNGKVRVFKGPNEKYRESILSGLRVYHNPYAELPIDPTLFRRPEIFQATAIGPAVIRTVADSGHILVNRVATLFPEGTMRRVLEGAESGKSYWYETK
ncbi:MAG: hypothetical protein KDD69_13700 [Bdellovibrionales bacterium]|nr:hypothetical protein [Bdellovibrionales bacterium]